MYVQAGAGIVADSVPESEHQECQHKARALLRAAEEAVRFAATGRGQLLSPVDPARALLDAVIAFYDGPGRAGDAGADAMLDAVRRFACGYAASITRPPRAIAASALLRAALPHSRSLRRYDRSGSALLFRWRQNPNYTAANMGAAFMAGYGYVEFAGPKEALFDAPDDPCRPAAARRRPALSGARASGGGDLSSADRAAGCGGVVRRTGEPSLAGRAIHHPSMIDARNQGGRNPLARALLLAWRHGDRSAADSVMRMTVIAQLIVAGQS